MIEKHVEFTINGMYYINEIASAINMHLLGIFKCYSVSNIT